MSCWPYFFDTTITAERYREIIVQFISLLKPERYCTLQQDNATAHTAADTLNMLKEFFDDQLISTNHWPPRSPDLSLADYFLWGFLKDRVYMNTPQTLEDLHWNITAEIDHITPDLLKKVHGNMVKQARACIVADGKRFEHLL